MNKMMIAILLFAVAVFAPVDVYANSEIRIYVNGVLAELEQPAIIVEGRTLVPVRGVFDLMGFDIEWDNATRSVYLRYALSEFIIVIGRYHFRRSDQIWSLDVPAQIINGRTMLPLSAISEAFGAIVTWDGEQRIVSISTQPVSPYTPLLSMFAFEPFQIFFVSENGEVKNDSVQVVVMLDSVLEAWAELNELTSVFYIVDVRMGEDARAIGSPRMPHIIAPAGNCYALYLSHSEELETRLQGEHGLALLESLENTLRGLYYFGNFELHLVGGEL